MTTRPTVGPAPPPGCRQLIEGGPIPPDEHIDYGGAPLRVRAAVSGALSRDDRLATIRSFFADAQHYQADNFIYTNPDTCRVTIYNSPGLDFGDLPTFGMATATALGGAIGATISAPTAPATAGMGPIIGGALGGAAGAETYNHIARTFFGTVDSRSLPQRTVDVFDQLFGGISGGAAGRVTREVLEEGLRRGLQRLSPENRQTVVEAGADLVGSLYGEVPVSDPEEAINYLERNMEDGTEPLDGPYLHGFPNSSLSDRQMWETLRSGIYYQLAEAERDDLGSVQPDALGHVVNQRSDDNQRSNDLAILFGQRHADRLNLLVEAVALRQSEPIALQAQDDDVAGIEDGLPIDPTPPVVRALQPQYHDAEVIADGLAIYLIRALGDLHYIGLIDDPRLREELIDRRQELGRAFNYPESIGERALSHLIERAVFAPELSAELVAMSAFPDIEPPHPLAATGYLAFFDRRELWRPLSGIGFDTGDTVHFYNTDGPHSIRSATVVGAYLAHTDERRVVLLLPDGTLRNVDQALVAPTTTFEDDGSRSDGNDIEP